MSLSWAEIEMLQGRHESASAWERQKRLLLGQKYTEICKNMLYCIYHSRAELQITMHDFPLWGFVKVAR